MPRAAPTPDPPTPARGHPRAGAEAGAADGVLRGAHAGRSRAARGEAGERTAARGGARAALADTLRTLREGAGLTQEQLGVRAGLHRTYVGGYERAERRLSVEALEQVLAALGASWAAFGAEMDARVKRPTPRRTRRPAPPPASR